MAKWQPIMFILDERLECECGTLAIFVSVLQPEDAELSEEGKRDLHYKAYCQSCFEKAQEEEE
jgi:hypothetical protein